MCRSHFIPRALYPTKNQRSATVTRGVASAGPPRHIKDHLLCRDCETRFEQNGESEVLKWLTPKAKRFSLGERLKVSLPRERFSDVDRFAAYDLGLDAAKFAYFAVSIIWRGAVHEWDLPDGTVTTLLKLGNHQETIRQYLLGDAGFPHQVVSVIVMVAAILKPEAFGLLPAKTKRPNATIIVFLREVSFLESCSDQIFQFFSAMFHASHRDGPFSMPIARGESSRTSRNFSKRP